MVDSPTEQEDAGRMSSNPRQGPIEYLYTLQRTPYTMAPIIHQFYKHSTPRDRDLLLSYLVLPMVLFPPMRKFILNSTKRSTLRTLCQDQRRIVGLTNRVQELKPLTHASMLVLTAERGIEVSPALSVKSIRAVQTANTSRDYLDAGRKLAIIFSDADVVSIYRTLGFKAL